MWIKTQYGDEIFNSVQLDKIYTQYDKEKKIYKIYALKGDLFCELGDYYTCEDCNFVLDNLLGAISSNRPFVMYEANFRSNPGCKKNR